MFAYHCIFGMYGFWLPNDPRGSWSDYVAAWELYRYGSATKTDSRRSVAGAPHDRQRRFAAKESLKFPAVKIDIAQATSLVTGFETACRDGKYVIYACAVLSDHVHIVLGWHARHVRQVVGHLKSEATRQIKAAGLWPYDERPLWGEHGWNVFLDELAGVSRAMAYVEANPLKEGLAPQRWSLVTPFDPAVAISRPAPNTSRKIGGAALRSMEGYARRKRRG